MCVCESVCCGYIWLKVHDHEANYLAKLGESLALSGDEVELFKLCNSATILLCLLSSVLSSTVYSALPAWWVASISAAIVWTWNRLLNRHNGPSRAETRGTNPTQPDSTRPSQTRPSRQPQHESLMISANDWVTCCKSVAIHLLLPCSSHLQLPARVFNCPQLITNKPQKECRINAQREPVFFLCFFFLSAGSEAELSW